IRSMEIAPKVLRAECTFSRRSFVRLLALACASQLLVSRSAQGDDPDWIDRYIPSKLRPLLANAVALASGYNDVGPVVAVGQQILNFLLGNQISSQEMLLVRLQNK